MDVHTSYSVPVGVMDTAEERDPHDSPAPVDLGRRRRRSPPAHSGMGRLSGNLRLSPMPTAEGRAAWNVTPGPLPKTLPPTVPEGHSLTREDAMKLLSAIADIQEMRATARHVWKGAGVVSTFTVVGGLLIGPPGLALGGTVGGLVAWMTSESFKPVPEILMELSPAEKQKLLNELRGILKNRIGRDIADLIQQVLHDESVQEQVVDMLKDFLQTRQLKVKVLRGR